MKTVDLAVQRRAAEQLSLVGRRQALDLGMTERQIEARVSSGLLVPVHAGVYRLAGSSPSWEQALLAACMATGPRAVASHRGAGRLWCLRGMERSVVEITVASPGRRELGGVVTHRTTRLDPIDRTSRLSVPLTTPARTLLDLGSVVPVEAVESALEDALMRGLVSFGLLTRTLARLGRSGRRGTAVLRSLVEERDPATAPTESVLEDGLLRVLRQGDLPEPVRQYEIGGVGLDFAYPHVRLGIEVDSRIWHGARTDIQRNSDKGNRLLARGWRVLHFTWFDVRHRPEYVIACVARELALACPA